MTGVITMMTTPLSEVAENPKAFLEARNRLSRQPPREHRFSGRDRRLAQ